MCDHDDHDTSPAIVDAGARASSSRRRRIWELSHACHCPLIGVGLPLGVLRKLVVKVSDAAVAADDYDVHVCAVSECGARNRLAQSLQKELERRYAVVVARFRPARTCDEVGQLWRAALAEGDVAGAFWAGLTHPRCDTALEEQMCRDIHMAQHQAGACVRADLRQFQALVEQNARLSRELLVMQQRNQALSQEKTEQNARHEALLMQATASAIGKDSVIAALRADLERLRASIPELASRARLSERLSQMEQRERALKGRIAELETGRPRAPASPGVEPEPAPTPAPGQVRCIKMPIRLVDQSVLCVGGRSGNVATYRALIERVGAQFAHHDGGLEDSAGLLGSSLAAADLVICQTGCISHSAYWRVKDYCKRTGKRCVFIDNPSISSLARGLQEASAEAASETGADDRAE
ncbi:MAG: DUF2325 domain-containing protein [Burkholderiaceae bacterium]|nr:DUF2325 domain-containing protein [Burkholderiaceae bacterium]